MRAIKTFKASMLAASLALSLGTAHAAQDTASPQAAQVDASKIYTSGTTIAQGSSGGSGEVTGSSSAFATSGANQAVSSGQSNTGTAAASKGQPGSSKGQTAQGPVYLLVPVDSENNQSALKQGCWAKMYDRENYLGTSLTLVGPTAIADMDEAGMFGFDWDDRVESLELGPKATLTVYDNENYLDMAKQFKGGQRIPDVSTRTGFFDEFSSIKIDCQRG